MRPCLGGYSVPKRATLPRPADDIWSMNTKTRPAGPPSPYSLFGLDLTVAWRFLCEGWQDILRHPALSGWLPSESLRLIRPDRSEVVVAAGRVLAGAKGRPQLAAVELPEDMVLRKTLHLPDLSRAGTHSAARLEAAASSPFPAQDLSGAIARRARSKGSRSNSCSARAQPSRHSSFLWMVHSAIGRPRSMRTGSFPSSALARPAVRPETGRSAQCSEYCCWRSCCWGQRWP